jgi:hypothetical protein
MAKVIYKYPLTINTNQFLNLPKGAKILTVQLQSNIPYIWALVDPKEETGEVPIYMVGTDISFPNPVSLEYIGTVQIVEREVTVWHIFRK